MPIFSPLTFGTGSSGPTTKGTLHGGSTRGGYAKAPVRETVNPNSRRAAEVARADARGGSGYKPYNSRNQTVASLYQKFGPNIEQRLGFSDKKRLAHMKDLGARQARSQEFRQKAMETFQQTRRSDSPTTPFNVSPYMSPMGSLGGGQRNRGFV